MIKSRWNIPRCRDALVVRTHDGEELHVRRHGSVRGNRLLFAHANGMAADAYVPFWSLLLDDFEVFVYDLRNHGRNAVGSLANHHVPAFAHDQTRVVTAVNDVYGARPVVGIFHSVSGLASLLPAAGSSLFSARLLIDPPLCDPGTSYEDYVAACSLMVQRTRNRTAWFRSREDLVELHRYMPIFYRSLPGVIELVADTTLRPSVDGDGFELCCPPEYEAKIYDTARTMGCAYELSNLDCPTKVLGADPSLPSAYAPTQFLSEIKSLDYEFVPEATHFMLLEQPELCVELLLEFLGRHGVV